MGITSLFSRRSYDQQHPPGPSRGILSWVKETLGSWLGPRLSAGTSARAEVTSEKAASGPRGIVFPWFLPYFDDKTGETAEMRRAYRLMLADPNVKSALLGKVLEVGALELKVQPADKKSHTDRAIAKFCEWNLAERLTGGMPELVWNVAGAGLIDGYSVCEKVLAPEERGRYRNQIILKDLKAKDTGNDVILLTDEYRNVVGVQGLRYNAGQIFSPSAFVIYRHLPLFHSPTGMSDFRAVYSRYWLLDTALKLRAVNLDKRAMPILLGTYQDPSTQPSLETALRLAKSQYWIAVPETAKIEALNIAGAADDIFASAIKDLKHDIFLGIAGAILQAIEGSVVEGRGNSQVHRSTADLFIWYLAATVQSCLNDRDDGLIKDLVDLNFVVDDYPRATLSAVNNNELLQDLQIDQGLAQIGVPLSLEEVYERYGRTPPQGPEDVLRQTPTPGATKPGSPVSATFFERFCQEGENKGMPGPCPEGGSDTPSSTPAAAPAAPEEPPDPEEVKQAWDDYDKEAAEHETAHAAWEAAYDKVDADHAAVQEVWQAEHDKLESDYTAARESYDAREQARSERTEAIEKDHVEDSLNLMQEEHEIEIESGMPDSTNPTADGYQQATTAYAQQYTQCFSTAFVSNEEGASYLEGALREAGATDADVARVNAVAEKGQAAVEKAAAKYQEAVVKHVEVGQALAAHDLDEPVEPEEPDELNEPDREDYETQEDYEQDRKEYEDGAAAHEKWEADRDRWEKDHEKWDGQRDKLIEKQNDLEAKCDQLASDLDVAFDTHKDRVNDAVGKVQERLLGVVGKEAEQDEEPQEPEHPEEPDVPDADDYPEEPEPPEEPEHERPAK